MTKFRIPDELKPGFKELSELKDNDFNIVIGLLNEIEIGTGPNTFQRIFSEKFKSFEFSLLPQVIYSFGSLLLRNSTTTLDELAEELVKSYDEKINAKLELRIKLIFENSEKLKLTIKAFELLSENNHLYSNARIITDIRTIFNDDIEHSKRNAVIFHNIKLVYQDSNEQKEFFISLDNTDLIKLKDKIERALKKETEIRKDYHQSFNFITTND